MSNLRVSGRGVEIINFGSREDLLIFTEMDVGSDH